MYASEMKLARLGSAIGLVLLMVLSSAFAQDRKPFKPTLSLKLSGGWGSALPKDDIDRQLESVNGNETFEFWREVDPSRVIGEIRPLNNHLPEWELELIATFGSRISLGFATSIPHKKTAESSLRYVQVPGEEGQIIDMTYGPAIKVGSPIKFRAYYSLLHGSKYEAYFNGGICINPAEIKEYRSYAITLPSGARSIQERYTHAVARFPLGFHGGLCFSYRLTKAVAIVIEAEWRIVRLTDFGGTNRFVDNDWTPEGDLVNSTSRERHGKLYFFTQEDPFIGARYVDFAIWDKIPDASVYLLEDIRKVRLGLSRSAIRVGIRLQLF